jgi:hypothetical protein
MKYGIIPDLKMTELKLLGHTSPKHMYILIYILLLERFGLSPNLSSSRRLKEESTYILERLEILERFENSNVMLNVSSNTVILSELIPLINCDFNCAK